MFTDTLSGKSVGDIKENSSVIELDIVVAKLSVSPIHKESSYTRADESSVSMITLDASGADLLLPAFDSIRVSEITEQRADAARDTSESDAFDSLGKADLLGQRPDEGKCDSNSYPSDSAGITEPATERDGEAEALVQSDETCKPNHPLIVYTSYRRSARNAKSDNNNDTFKPPRNYKRKCNKKTVLNFTSLQISRRRRSLLATRSRSSVWGFMGNILPDLKENSDLELSISKERKVRRVRGDQGIKKSMNNQKGKKSIGKPGTPSGPISLKIKIGNQICSLVNVAKNVNATKLKLEGEVPRVVASSSKKLESVMSSDGSVLSTNFDVRDTVEKSCLGTSKDHQLIVNQIEVHQLEASIDNRSSDPGTSPDSEVINSEPDCPLSQKAISNMEGSSVLSNDCVSAEDVSRLKVRQSKSKRGKKNDKLLKAEKSNADVPAAPEIGQEVGYVTSFNEASIVSLLNPCLTELNPSSTLVAIEPSNLQASNTLLPFTDGQSLPKFSGNSVSAHFGDIGSISKGSCGPIESLSFSVGEVREQYVPRRNAWVLCDDCEKWRRIPATLADQIEETNCGWTCKENTDKDFADCSVAQEKSNAEINVELEISDASCEEDGCDASLDSNQNQSIVSQQSSWSLIKSNLFLHRSRKTQTVDEVMVCHCKPPSDGRMGCGSKCLNRMLNIECVRGTCPCGELCSNQQFQRRKYAKLKWFKCGRKGYGLQALDDIPEGQFLIEYVGEVLDVHAYQERQRTYALKGHKHFYFMTLNGSEVIDACAKGNLGRFINHSCDPNCRTEKWMVNGEVCVGLFAVKDIKKGEEVTFDYNYVRVFGAAAKKCVCGSLNCRGYIGGDPSNSEVIVQGDSDDEFSEPLMICEDKELNDDWNDIMSNTLSERDNEIANESGEKMYRMNKMEYAAGLLETTKEAHSSRETQDGGGDIYTSSQEFLTDDVKQLDMDKETGESLNRSSPAAFDLAAEDIVSQKPCSVELKIISSKSDDSMKSTCQNEPSSAQNRVENSSCSALTRKSLPAAVKFKGKLKYAAEEGRKEQGKAHPLTKTHHSSTSTKKGKVKSIVVGDKGTPNVDKSNVAPNKSDNLPELFLNSHFETVEEKLNELLDPEGGISKRKDASRGYLKLLFLTAASGNNGHGEAIQSNRDLSMILDALLKTKSRTVLVDVINKNGLQMLHNILKQCRREFIKTPILRKLLKILEYMATREILKLEHITGGPPRPGVESIFGGWTVCIIKVKLSPGFSNFSPYPHRISIEPKDIQVFILVHTVEEWIYRIIASFKDSVLTLTEHADKQVHQSARSFRDKWIPRSLRKNSCTERDDARMEYPQLSSHDRVSMAHDIWSNQSRKLLEATNCRIEQPVAASCTNDLSGSEPISASVGSVIDGTKTRKRKSRWDNPADELPNPCLRTNLECDGNINADDDIPPGFSSPCNVPVVPSDPSSTPINCQEREGFIKHPYDTVLGDSQQRYNAYMSTSYGIPSSVMQQYGVRTEISDCRTIAPGVPFHPFPPLPPYPRSNLHPPSCTAVSAPLSEPVGKPEQGSPRYVARQSDQSHLKTPDMDSQEMNISCANGRPDFMQGGNSYSMGRKYFRQQKWNNSKVMPPPWIRMRNVR
ncbi:histone-lysine N-methyltransferase ASHH2 [Dorcoceras hygrometricum]|uniref:Histone-lysine N-methyltransferase ASHH2 n=1 Tax=Dorcoceras hygrometricum TaxID=472368 RepID=A0A2Z7CGW0_9LAMI|nr:histone-lysine N-methyltransferase ASHH2 [Dorcoceras hygrometricum]